MGNEFSVLCTKIKWEKIGNKNFLCQNVIHVPDFDKKEKKLVCNFKIWSDKDQRLTVIPSTVNTVILLAAREIGTKQPNPFGLPGTNIHPRHLKLTKFRVCLTSDLTNGSPCCILE